MAHTPLSRYQQDLQKEDFVEDAAQRVAVTHLQRLYDELLSARLNRESWFAKVFGKAGERDPVTGIYFWGGVGRGKTWLMDLFFDCLPFEQKMRAHFHRFMQKVHHERKVLNDLEDPLNEIAKRLAAQTRIICFDEFVVNDVADAVILVKIMQGLFARGVSLVATSNVEPVNLYKGGLQRELFMPAIDLIYQHCEVVELDSGTDYRLRFLDKAETWFYPLDDRARAGMAHNFAHLAPETGTRDGVIEIEGRALDYVRRADSIIWFSFADLCDGPRSQNDYLELACCFQSVLIEQVPVMDRLMEDQARRFINMIDVFYDHNVKVIISAAATVDSIYTGSRNTFEFQRTISRLKEMQSHDYLALCHKTA